MLGFGLGISTSVCFATGSHMVWFISNNLTVETITDRSTSASLLLVFILQMCSLEALIDVLML